MNVIYGFGVLCLLAGIAAIVLLTSTGLQSDVSARTVTFTCPAYDHNTPCNDKSTGCNGLVAYNVSHYCLYEHVIQECAKTCGCCGDHWLEWGPWECHSVKPCYNARYRKCNGVNCSSDGSKGFEIQSCYNATSCENPSEKRECICDEWGPTSCQYKTNQCFMHKSRNCSSACPIADKNLIDVIDSNHTCPCAPDPTETSKCICDEWGPTSCQYKTNQCFMHKSRNCSSVCPIADINHIDVIDSNHTCPCAPDHWHEWGPWECHSVKPCYNARYRKCNGGNCSNDGSKGFEIQSCYNASSCENPTEKSECICDEWGPTSCQYKTNQCFMHKSRNCSSTCPIADRNHIDVIDSDHECPCAPDHWLDWGPWNCHSADPCFLARYRNCSGTYCSSDGSKNFELQKCNATRCENPTQKVECICDEWGPTKCQYKTNQCFMHKSRNCSSSCPPGDNYHIDVIASDQVCPCAPDSTEKSECICDEWGPTNCQYQNNQCFMHKSRNCSSSCPTTDENHSDYIDSNHVCPCAPDHWLVWGPWECRSANPCFLARYRNCSGTYCSSDGSKDFELQSCNATRCENQTTTSECICDEWGPTKCQYQTNQCFMHKSRNCSSSCPPGNNYHIEVIASDQVCPCAPENHWLAWGPWRCHSAEPCLLSRYRNCSGGNCSSDNSKDFELQSCNDTECENSSTVTNTPHHGCLQFKQSGRECIDSAEECAHYKDFCNMVVNITSLCPKTCGCCESDALTTTRESTTFISKSEHTSMATSLTNTVTRMLSSTTQSTIVGSSDSHMNTKSAMTTLSISSSAPSFSNLDNSLSGFAQWGKWSSWKCKLGLKGTCSMSRYRNCSTSAKDDCIGDHSETINCTHDDCPDHFGVVALCTLFESSNLPCMDYEKCEGISLKPILLCSEEPKYCPVTCGCCDPNLTASVLSTLPQTVSPSLTTGSNLSEPMTSKVADTPATAATVIRSSTTTIISISSTTISSYWEEWGNWQCKTVDEGKCVMFRNRNCSTGDNVLQCGTQADRTYSTDCNEHICKDLFNLTQCANYYENVEKCFDEGTACLYAAPGSPTCSVDIASHICPKSCGCCENEREGYVVWESWSSWTCKNYSKDLITPCLMSRTRLCSTGKPADCNGSFYEIKGCTESVCLGREWADWSPWHCQLGLHSTNCTMSRSRQCLVPSQDCKGNSSEISPCTQEECPHHFGVRINCSLFESSNYHCTETPGCNDLIQIPNSVCAHEILKCPISCGCCDPSSAVVSNYTTKTTQASLSSFTETITPFRSDSPTSTFPLTQFSTTATEMQSTTSTKIPISTETFIHWGEWGYWRCKTEDHGKCVMFRTRNCTEGDIINCSTLNESKEFTECKQQICGDLFNLTRCANYSDSVSHCTEEASSCPGLNPSSQACNNVNIASSICPKSCGCCENEIEGHSVWESWSSWTCEILKSDLSSTCHMYRSRHCLSGDCEGLTFETTECHYSNCSGAGITHVNCSLFNRSSTCEDQANCTYFADKPWQFCSNAAFVAKCPRLCTCCGVSVEQCIDLSLGCANIYMYSNRAEYCKTPSITDLCPKTCGVCGIENIGNRTTIRTDVSGSTTASSVTPHSNGNNSLITSNGLKSTTSTLTDQGTGLTDTSTSPSVNPTGNENTNNQTTIGIPSTTSTLTVQGTGVTNTATVPSVIPTRDENTNNQTTIGLPSTTTSSPGQETGVTNTAIALTVTPTGNENTNNQTTIGIPSTMSTFTDQGTGVTNTATVPSVTPTGNETTNNQTTIGLSSTTTSSPGQGTASSSTSQEAYGSDSTTASSVTPTRNVNTNNQTTIGLPSTTSSSASQEAGGFDSTTASHIIPTGNLNTNNPTTIGLPSTTSSSTSQGAGGSDSTTALQVTPTGNVNTNNQTTIGLPSTTSSSTSHGAGGSDSTTASEVTPTVNENTNNQTTIGLPSTTSTFTDQVTGVANTATVLSVTPTGNENTNNQTTIGLPSTTTSSPGQGTGVTNTAIVTSVTPTGNENANNATFGLPSTTSSSTSQGAGGSDSTSAAHVTPTGNVNTNNQTTIGLPSTTTSSTSQGAGGSDSTTASQIIPTGNVNTNNQTTIGLSSTTTSSTSQGAGGSDSTTAAYVTPTGNANTNNQTPIGLPSTTSLSTSQEAGGSDSTTASSVTPTRNANTNNQTTIGIPTTNLPVTSVLTSTSKIPYTIGPRTTKCFQCAGPDFLCEKLYEEVECDSSQNYCINKIVNKKDGTRSVWRGCGTFDTCYKDWFLGSSDIDKCRQFEENNFLTLDFDCTFCCITDDCNEPLRPDSSTLYKDL